MYRDIVAVAKSSYRMFLVQPSLRLAYVLGHISANVVKTAVESLGFDGSNWRVRVNDGLMPGVLTAALKMTSYLDLRRRGFDISAVRYEDLVARPLDMCRVLLDFCHLPQSLAELAIIAFDVDAHRNAPVANSIIGHFKEPELTPQAKEKLNEMLKKYRIPLIGETDNLDGTLSCY